MYLSNACMQHMHACTALHSCLCVVGALSRLGARASSGQERDRERGRPVVPIELNSETWELGGPISQATPFRASLQLSIFLNRVCRGPPLPVPRHLPSANDITLVLHTRDMIKDMAKADEPIAKVQEEDVLGVPGKVLIIRNEPLTSTLSHFLTCLTQARTGNHICATANDT